MRGLEISGTEGWSIEETNYDGDHNATGARERKRRKNDIPLIARDWGKGTAVYYMNAQG